MVGTYSTQGILAVGGKGEERPVAFGALRVGLEYLCADSGLRKRDRGGGSRDAAPGYQHLHRVIPPRPVWSVFAGRTR
jgi:hypothetical protein